MIVKIFNDSIIIINIAIVILRHWDQIFARFVILAWQELAWNRERGRQAHRKTDKQAWWDSSNNGDRFFQEKTETSKNPKVLGYELQTKQKGKGWMGKKFEWEQRKIKLRGQKTVIAKKLNVKWNIRSLLRMTLRIIMICTTLMRSISTMIHCYRVIR